MPGRVNLDTELGMLLRALARQPDVLVCVEIGTWNGEGSTYCIAQGLHETSGHLVGIELNPVFYEQAVRFYSDKALPVEIINGLALSLEDYPDPEHFEGQARDTFWERTDPGSYKRWYVEEREMARCAGRVNVLRDIVEREGHVDLAFLDGGKFTSTSEFVFLEPHIRRYVVLDDTSAARSIKNAAAREWLQSSPHWKIVRDELDQGNGWLAACRRSERVNAG
jgi:hypothetical protein